MRTVKLELFQGETGFPPSPLETRMSLQGARLRCGYQTIHVKPPLGIQVILTAVMSQDVVSFMGQETLRFSALRQRQNARLALGLAARSCVLETGNIAL